MECSHYMKNFDVGRIPLRMPRSKQLLARPATNPFCQPLLPLLFRLLSGVRPTFSRRLLTWIYQARMLRSEQLEVATSFQLCMRPATFALFALMRGVQCAVCQLSAARCQLSAVHAGNAQQVPCICF